MTLQKVWDLQIDPLVQKVLTTIPRRYAKRILIVIGTLHLNPYFGDIQKMKGTKHVWRRRVGEYRLFYKIFQEKHTILVFHLERRSSSTY